MRFSKANLVFGVLFCALSSGVEASFFMRELIGIEGPKRFAQTYAKQTDKSASTLRKIFFTHPSKYHLARPETTLTLSLRDVERVLRQDELRQAVHLEIFDEVTEPSAEIDRRFRTVMRFAYNCRSVHVKEAPISDMALSLLSEQIYALAFEDCSVLSTDFCVNIPRSVTHLALDHCKNINDKTLEALSFDMPQLKTLFIDGCFVSAEGLSKFMRKNKTVILLPQRAENDEK